MNLLKTMGNHISVALVDLNLEGTNGFDLIAAMHSRQPELPIIAISGVYTGPALESAKMIGAVETLQKPIDRESYTILERTSARKEAGVSERDNQFPIERLTQGKLKC